MKYWGTLPLRLHIEVLQHNYGSEGWGFESLQAHDTHEDFTTSWVSFFLDRSKNLFDLLLGITKQHLGVLFVEQRVSNTCIARCH